MPRRTSVSLEVVERGAGTPVLALHGWSPDHRLMLGCLEPVFAGRPGYRRLYPDLPGMGVSPAPAEIASSDDVLDTVQDVVDDLLADTPFLLVGESYGGYLARALARSRPEQVLGLALVCPIGTAVDRADRRVPRRQVLRPDPDLLAATDDDTAARFADVAVVQSPETLRRFREDILPGLDAADGAALERIARRWRLAEDPEGGAPFTRPTLILTGRQDHSTGYLDQFALLPHYPRATFAVLDVAGHNLQIEQPALFDALVGEWLDRVAAEG
ncbi:Pimeloyl-ACP methyl ester carboxylesterase [Micromonospora citrea]|uniref:Pimeloyl-ACP methyl ester carboxylesterase n=1 Tax=Micromonospora citrea TaxID=47855 RepID=A0A1C6UW82_9ACTN|nr:alpha/beta hydrolase [Micromonospora citrea]SCL58297.1 Pimeloyl-ACP methyl ester carboxylesterase [Micromonospora citrea]